MRTLETVQRNFPNLRVIARARNRQHAYALLGAGVERVIRETFHGSVEAARVALEDLGLPAGDARDVVWEFVERDEEQVRQSFHLRDDLDALIAAAREYTGQLESLFEADAER
jgi:voltage-gated potassium channel Kch